MSENKAPDRVIVDVGSGPRELYMSFGLLNEITSLVGGMEAIPMLQFDPVISISALELILATRDKRGRILHPEGDDADPIIPLELSPATAEEILGWAADHALDFFVRQYAKSASLFANKAEKLAEVGSSLTSSANLAGKTA